MSEDDFGFCPHCGRKLAENSTYCPECGGILNYDAAGSNGYTPNAAPYQPYRGKGKDRPMDSQFLICFLLLLVYSILSLIGGLTMAFNAEGMVTMLNDMLVQSGTTLEEFYASMGITITESELVSYMQITGVLELLTAIPAAAATVLCLMRRKHMYAVIGAGLSTAAVLVSGVVAGDIFGSLFGVLIGAVVTYMLYKNCVDYFED